MSCLHTLWLTQLLGYICGQNNCIPPAGVSSIVQNCPADYYLCPASFNYGCCLTGYGCATNVCYITTPSTITYTQTATTTVADGQTVTTTRTATTVQTPTPPTALPTTTNADAIAKFIPTTVAKVPATSTPSSDGSGGGLTTPQLGGIIGGAIAILIVVIAAAVIVIRRLNRVADVVETRKASSSGDQSKPARPGGGRGRPNMTQYGMSYDPLMVGTPADSGPGTPQGISGGLEVDGRNRSNSDYSQPAVTPYGYSGTPSEGQRHPSLDSSQGGGYFDIPARVHNMPARHSMRTRTDSQGNVQYGGGHVHISQQQPQHGRQWSNASEFSNDSSDHQPGVGSPLIPAELDIAGGFIPELPSADAISPDGDGTRRRSGSGTIGSPRPSLGHSRRHSSGTSAAAGAGMPSPGSVAGHQPLDVVNESSEIMHGHYGPRYNQAGQTAAGLDIHDDVSSPLAVRFTERRHGQ